MKLVVEIHPYNLEFRSKVSFYSFRFPNTIPGKSGENALEIEKFYERFDDAQYGSSLKDIQGLIQNMGREFGAQERFFRREGKAHALPSNAYYRPLLRLYCLRCCERVVILGNGGIKASGKAIDSPDCYPHFLVMNAISRAFSRIRKSCCDLPSSRSPFILEIEVEDRQPQTSNR